MIKHHVINKYTHDYDTGEDKHENYQCNYTDDGDFKEWYYNSEDPNTAYKLTGTRKNEIGVLENINSDYYNAEIIYRPDWTSAGAIKLKVLADEKGCSGCGMHGYLGRIERVDIDFADYYPITAEDEVYAGDHLKFHKSISIYPDILQQGGYDKVFEMLEFINKTCENGDLPYGDLECGTEIVYGEPLYRIKDPEEDKWDVIPVYRTNKETMEQEMKWFITPSNQSHQ